MCLFYHSKIITLSSKSIQTEKAKFSHFDRTRGDKNQIFRSIVSAFWMSFHPLLEGPNEQVTQKYMKGSRYVQLLLYFILISLKVWFILAIWNPDNKHVVLFKLISYFSWFVMHLFKINTCTLRLVISKLFDMAVILLVKSSENDSIFLPAFYLIIWVMKNKKKF